MFKRPAFILKPSGFSFFYLVFSSCSCKYAFGFLIAFGSFFLVHHFTVTLTLSPYIVHCGDIGVRTCHSDISFSFFSHFLSPYKTSTMNYEKMPECQNDMIVFFKYLFCLLLSTIFKTDNTFSHKNCFQKYRLDAMNKLLVSFQNKT